MPYPIHLIIAGGYEGGKEHLYSTASYMISAAAALCVTDRGWRSAYATASARAHELWPAAKHPHFTVVCCIIVSTHVVHVNIMLLIIYQPRRD